MVDSPMWPSTIPSSVISGGGAGDDRWVGRGDDAGRGLLGDREELVGRGWERHDAGVGPEDPERHQLIAGRAPELVVALVGALGEHVGGAVAARVACTGAAPPPAA